MKKNSLTFFACLSPLSMRCSTRYHRSFVDRIPTWGTALNQQFARTVCSRLFDTMPRHLSDGWTPGRVSDDQLRIHPVVFAIGRAKERPGSVCSRSQRNRRPCRKHWKLVWRHQEMAMGMYFLNDNSHNIGKQCIRCVELSEYLYIYT